MVSALSGNRAQRAWALNVLLVLSFRQELRLGSTPGLLAALLPVRVLRCVCCDGPLVSSSCCCGGAAAWM